MPLPSAFQHAPICECTTHRRDAFYIVESEQRQYYVLVLGRIDLSNLTNNTMKEYIVASSTASSDLQQIKSSKKNVLILYMADDNQKLLDPVERSVISIDDVPLLAQTINPASSIIFEERARAAITALEYISVEDKIRLKGGMLGFDKETSLRRANSLLPVKGPMPNPLLNPSFVLFESVAESPSWTITKLPTLLIPTWNICRRSDRLEKTCSYSEFWTLLNATLNHVKLSDTAEYTRLKTFTHDEARKSDSAAAFPMEHTAIQFRVADGDIPTGGFVIHVHSPLENASDIDIVTLKGATETHTFHVDTWFSTVSALNQAYKPGWTSCPGGKLPEPIRGNSGILCQPAQHDPQARTCHLCATNFTTLTVAQRRDHYNQLHTAQVKSSILQIPDNLEIKQCEMCRLVFTRKGLPKHKSNCSSKVLRCPFDNCRQEMTARGSSGPAHMVQHLKINHADPEDTSVFSEESAKTIRTITHLAFCVCPKHPLHNLNLARLYTRKAMRDHLKPSTTAGPAIGEGETWTNAFAFISRTLETLDPEHVSFAPVWGKFRTKYFDYYHNRHVSSVAFAAYDSLQRQLISLPPDDDSPIAVSLWFLVTYFDPLIFRGDKRSFSKNIKAVRDCVNQRVRLLLDGKIEELWLSLLGNSDTSLQQSFETPKELRVADLMEKGRFSDAANAAVSDLERPLMDDSAIDAFRDSVIPPSLQHPGTDGVQRRSDRDTPEVDQDMFAFIPDSEEAHDPDLKKLSGIITTCKKGKGAGFLGDTLDFYKVAIRSNHSANSSTLSSLLEIVRRILRGQLPLQMRPAYNLLAGSLFVKPESMPRAYRPIGCPSSLNRLVGKFFCSFTREKISIAMLQANQFAVGVKGGMTLLLASLQLLVQKFMDLDEEDPEPNDMRVHSARALFSLDLTSMFNLCNLDVFFAWADTDPILSPFIPYLETRYKAASTYILKKSDGTFVHVTQPKGCAQGCPLAPLIASCCLLILIRQFLDGKMDQHVSPPSTTSVNKITHFTTDSSSPPVTLRSLQQLPSDIVLALASISRQSSESEASKGAPILSFMDDTSTVAPYSFILAFSRFLVRHGPSAGVYVNWRKTQVLLGSNGDKHWRDISEDGTTLRLDKDFVTALRDLGIPEDNIISTPKHGPTALAKIKGGIKILGAPFGFAEFNAAFRAKTLAKQMQAFDAVSEAATDKEHLYKLIRHCIIPKVYHMFTAASSLDAIAEYANASHAQHIVFFERYLNDGKKLDSNTKYSFELATLLIRQGGIQFTSPLYFYKAGYLASWSRLFFVGSPPSLDPEDPKLSPLHPSIQRIIDAERLAPTLPCCVDFNRCFENLLDLHPEEFGIEIAGGKGISGLIAAAAADKLQHTIVEATSRNRFLLLYKSLAAEEESSGVNSHLRKIMPSSAQMLASNYLDNLDMGPDKMGSESFHCYTKIKLGLPILDIKAGEKLDCPFCSKTKTLDRFGEHIYACHHFIAQRTKCMHNGMRDTVADVLGKLVAIGAPKASYVSSVTIEKTGLVNNTALRPADIYATFSSEKQVLNLEGQHVAVTAVALDITYTTMSDNSSYEGMTNTSSFSPAALPHLLKAEAGKRSDTHDNRTPGGTAHYLAGKAVAFVPIAFDYLGGMGPQASLLFFNTLTGRRAERELNGKTCKVSAADLTAENWVTPDRVPSDDATIHLPPFHPPCLNGQFKAAIDHIKKEAKPGENLDTWQIHAAVQRLTLTLSTRHAAGVATIARIFCSSISAAQGRIATLPSMAISEAYVKGEFVKAADLLRRSSYGVDLLLQKREDTALQSDDGWSDDNASMHNNSDNETARIHHPRRPLSRIHHAKQRALRSGSSVLPQKGHILDDRDDDSGGFEEHDPLPDLALTAVQDHTFGADDSRCKEDEVTHLGRALISPAASRTPSAYHSINTNSSIISLLVAPFDGTAGMRGNIARRVPMSHPAGAHLAYTSGMLVDSPQLAMQMALALRQLLCLPVRALALSQLTGNHNCHAHTRSLQSLHRLARMLLQTLEHSFANVTSLPRVRHHTHKALESALPHPSPDKDLEIDRLLASLNLANPGR